MRSAMILLLIASLLSCPIRCASGSGCTDSAGPADAVVASHTCCDTCGTQQTHQEEPSQPGCPCDDCACQACVCHGATVNADVVAIDLLAAFSVWLPVDTQAQRPLAKTHSRTQADDVPQSLPFASGRIARINLQSFQI